MKIEHVNIRTEKKLNKAEIVLCETATVKGLYYAIKGGNTTSRLLEGKLYHTVESISEILNSRWNVAVWNIDDEVLFNF